MAKRLVILGVTGSIGTQALECLDDELVLVGISYGQNEIKAKQVLARFSNQEDSLEVYSPFVNSLNTVHSMAELLKKTKPDLVLNAIVGWAGLEATQLCLKLKIQIALANKESLVIAGAFFRKFKAQILPVDSEHSSLHELMQVDPNSVQTIYITASGGPFYHLTPEERFGKQFSEAVQHPKWTMGAKISVDSADMINKCFELIEAHHLFPGKTISPLYHPQAIVHSLVEFRNGAVLANLSQPDMKLSIDLALHNFRKGERKIPRLAFGTQTLTMEAMDSAKWPPLAWATEIIQTDNRAMGAIINTVNDWAVEQFRMGQICFGQITEIIEKFLSKYKDFPVHKLADLFHLHDLIQADLRKEL